MCSYLGFGLMAGRAAVLAWEEAKAANPCILGDHQGSYEYGGMKYELVSHPSGASFGSCSKLVKLVLRQNQACGAPQVTHCASGDPAQTMCLLLVAAVWQMCSSHVCSDAAGPLRGIAGY